MSMRAWEDHGFRLNPADVVRPGPSDSVMLAPGEKAALANPELLIEPENDGPFEPTGVFRALRNVETLPHIKPIRRLRRKRMREREARIRKMSEREKAERESSERRRGIFTRFFGCLFSWKAG